jgi:threonine/homoserine/homoserine lactone efflux protein
VLGIHDLALFMLSGVLLNLTPGPDTLFILSHATRGARAGSMAALGIGAGCLLHIAAATIGLSALLLASATAFAALKTLGALYLIWIGISLLRSGAPGAPAAGPGGAAPGAARIFAQGALTNALNPKVAMFFLAFLPQFVDPAAPHRALGFLALGCLFNLTGTLWNLALAQLGSRALRRAPGLQRAAGWFARGVGALFVALGIRLAFTARAVP